MSTAAEPVTELLDQLAPILARIAELAPANHTTTAQIEALEQILEREFPHAGPRVQAIGALLARGVDEGWLANRGGPEARFSRVAKPSPATHQLSIDVVNMLGAGLEHTHTAGEITIGFPASSAAQNCQFEGRPPGWVFCGPGSRHVPTVEGGRMNLIYFLPDGAVKWH